MITSLMDNHVTLKEAHKQLGLSEYRILAILKGDWLHGIKISNNLIVVSIDSLKNLKQILKCHTSFKVGGRYLGIKDSKKLNHQLKVGSLSSIKVGGRRYISKDSLKRFRKVMETKKIVPSETKGVNNLKELTDGGRQSLLLEDEEPVSKTMETFKSESITEMPDGPWKHEPMESYWWRTQKKGLGICKGCSGFRRFSIESQLCESCHRKSILINETKITDHKKEPIIGFSISSNMLIPRRRSNRVLDHDEWVATLEKINSFYSTVSPRMIADVNKHINLVNSTNDAIHIGRFPVVGFVYLLRAENGRYKVGKTINMPKRLSEIQQEYPLEIRLIAFYKTKDYSQEEERIKKLTKEYAVGPSEWRIFPPKVEQEWIDYYENKMRETVYDNNSSEEIAT